LLNKPLQRNRLGWAFGKGMSATRASPRPADEAPVERVGGLYLDLTCSCFATESGEETSLTGRGSSEKVGPFRESSNQ